MSERECLLPEAGERKKNGENRPGAGGGERSDQPSRVRPPEAVLARRVRVFDVVGTQVVDAVKTDPKQRRTRVKRPENGENCPNRPRRAKRAMGEQAVVANGVPQSKQYEGDGKSERPTHS